MISFETFPECSLPSTVSKNAIKMIGHHARLRDLTQFMAVLVLITGEIRRSKLYFEVASWNHSLLNPAYGTISYEICRKITPFKTT